MKKCLPRKSGLYPPALFHYHRQNLKLFLLLIATFFTINVFAQQRITGTVSSRDSVLEGVTVQVKGSTTATQTDAKGNFSIVAPPNATLVLSNVGYTNQEIKVGNQARITVQLQPSTTQLTDVVVVGYGVQKKVTVTGAVTAVKGSIWTNPLQPIFQIHLQDAYLVCRQCSRALNLVLTPLPSVFAVPIP